VTLALPQPTRPSATIARYCSSWNSRLGGLGTRGETGERAAGDLLRKVLFGSPGTSQDDRSPSGGCVRDCSSFGSCSIVIGWICSLPVS
jgi:hypothetical protein